MLNNLFKLLPYYVQTPADIKMCHTSLIQGSKWQQRRKILTPAFHFNILKRFFITLEENSQRLIQSLEKSKGKTIDIIPVLSFYTLSAICGKIIFLKRAETFVFFLTKNR